MPRRRLGGAAFAFLFALVFAHASAATDERIVPDQDLSDLTREEQIGYLILSDQLADIHRWHQRLRDATGDDIRPYEYACARVGWHGGHTTDPSPPLLDLLNRAEMAREDAIGVVPASECDLGNAAGDFREIQSGQSATLVEMDVYPSDQIPSLQRTPCTGRYRGSWLTVRICGGLCGMGIAAYDIGEGAGPLWLARSACF